MLLRPGSHAPNPLVVAFGTQFGRYPDAGLGGVICFAVTAFLIASSLGFIYVAVCCSHINSYTCNQVRGHRTGSSHSGVEEYPREKKSTNKT